MKTVLIFTAVVVGSGYGVASWLNPDAIPIDQSVAAAAEGIVVVRVPDGRITVEGWETNEVHVVGTVSVSDPDLVTLTSNHGHVELRVIPDVDYDPAGTDLTVRVPTGSSIDIETDGADVNVDGVEGIVRLASGSGNLEVAGEPLGIVAQSQSGDINIHSVESPGFVHSEDGSVKLHGRAADQIASARFSRQEHGGRSIAGCWDEKESVDCREEQWEAYGEQWEAYGEQWERFGKDIAQLVSSAVQAIDVSGFVDINPRESGFDLDLTGHVDIDGKKLEAFFDDLEHYLENVEDEIGEGMVLLGEELEDLGDRLQHDHRRKR